MIRHMKLIFKILGHIEQQHSEIATSIPEFEGYSPCEVNYHVDLCLEAKYIRREGDAIKRIYRLTWEGHEVLDRFRESN